MNTDFTIEHKNKKYRLTIFETLKDFKNCRFIDTETGTVLNEWTIDKLDWIDVWNTYCLHIVNKNNNTKYRIFDLFTDEIIQEQSSVQLYIPSNIQLRGWVTKDGVLLSPSPSYDKVLLLIYVLHSEKFLFWRSFKCILGWCSFVVVSNKGNHFAVYDYEDDYTNIYDTESLKCLQNFRGSCFPTKLEENDTGLVLTLKSRHDNSLYIKTITK
jgi:hypothetical protein